MGTQDVYVENLNSVTSKLVDILDRLDSSLDKIDSVAVQIQDIQIYIRVVVWCIFFAGACYIANWLWKTWIRGLIRSYMKLPL